MTLGLNIDSVNIAEVGIVWTSCKNIASKLRHGVAPTKRHMDFGVTWMPKAVWAYGS